MNMTVEQLAYQLQRLTEEGHGSAVVCIDTHQPDFVGQCTGVPVARVAVGRDWNHGRVLLWPDNLLQPVIPEARIEPEYPKRDENGLYRHSARPDIGPELMKGFLRDRGFDFCTSYMRPPASDVNQGDPRLWSMPSKPGPKWFLWEITRNTSGDLIAIWIAPTN